MKRYVGCLLLALLLLIPANYTIYAADDDLTFSEYVDEIAGMNEPYWSFDYYPVLSFEHKFLWFEWGQAETVGWNIDTVSYYFTLNNVHKGEYLVGYNPSDMDITFDYVYSSVDESLNHYTSTATFTYSLIDLDFEKDYVEFNFSYDDILAGCEYYSQGYDTVLKSCEIHISSRILDKHGTISHYEFYADDNYAKQIYTGIETYMLTDEDMRLVTTLADSFKDVDETIDVGGIEGGNGGEVNLHHFVVVYPDSLQEVMFNLNDLLTMIFIDFPRAIWNVLKFIFEFILLLPAYIHMVLPFLPEYLIAAIMFVIVFGIVWGIIAWIRSIKVIK